MPGPTFAEIAARAGVGTATVERVLNGRGGVREDTARKVIAAARALDWPRRLPAEHRGILRIDVLMVRPETTFYRRLSRAFERVAATLDPAVQVHRRFLPEHDAAGIAAHIRRPGMPRSALILAVPDDPAIGAAVAALPPDMPAVQIVTRITGVNRPLVGIDNYAAGRTAAHFIARMAPRGGRILALGHPIYRVHRDRLRGFSDYLAETRPPGFQFPWIGFGLDDRARAAALLEDALNTGGIAALYNAGGANHGLIEVLRLHPAGRGVFFVGHELTEATAAALRDGVMDIVLDQAPETQARRALDHVMRGLGLSDVTPDAAPIRFVTVTPQNL